MALAKILIDGPSELIFDYAIAEAMSVQVGCRVTVPLRNGDATGTVIKITEENQDLGFAPRLIKKLIDPEPLITPPLMKLGNWMSTYYAAPLEHIMRALLPESVRQDAHSEKTRKIVCLVKSLEEEEVAKLKKKAPKQYQVYLLVKAVEQGIALSDLNSSAVKGLEKKQIIEIKEEQVRRDPDEGEEFLQTKPLTLNDEQLFRKL